jgi:ATP-binding cassette subfamily B protein
MDKGTRRKADREGRIDGRLLSRLWREARPQWFSILCLMLLGMLNAPLTLLGPVPLAIVVDSVIGDHPLPAWLRAVLPAAATRSDPALLGSAVALLILTTLLGQSRDLAHAMLRVRTGERLVLNLRSRIFRHVQRLSIAFHDKRGTADSLYRMQWDAPAIQSIAIDILIPLVGAALTLITMVAIMMRLDWQLACIALLIAPLLVLLSSIYRRKLRSRSRELKLQESAAFSVLQEVMGALRVVKAFGQEAREDNRFVTRANESIRVKLRLTLTEGGFALLVNLTTAVGTGLVLLVGVAHVQAGAITLGQLLIVMGYLGKLYDPLRTIGRKATSLQSHLAGAERAFALLDEAPDVVDLPNARHLARARGDVRFNNVSFGYDANRGILREATFDVAAGTRVGIVGTTGAGKTTLVSLLNRFIDPTTGTITLDGIDTREYRLEDLRRQFALVLQDPVLFSSSIGENIRYARPDATEDEVFAAAQAAQVHDFIMSLPDGYATTVGERGMRLSGGERQRISLARAFLKDAPILVLDEPTSAMDIKTEAAIMQAMEALMSGRTTFMIAHRLSTLESCSMRLNLESGAVDVTRTVNTSPMQGLKV